MIQTEWNDPHDGAMDYEEYARDAIGILRQNGSDTHADAISRLLVRVESLEAALAEARKDGERKGIAAWLTDDHARTREGKLCCVEVRRPDTHGGMACTWKMKDFDIQAEMDGCEVGEEIVLRYAELTDAEFTALGDFDGW